MDKAFLAAYSLRLVSTWEAKFPSVEQLVFAWVPVSMSEVRKLPLLGLVARSL